MTQLLVYTRNVFLRYAIDSLTDEHNSVTYFDNRVQFLACATVIDNAVLLIDAINDPDNSVRWLDFRLKKHKTMRSINYLVPITMLANSFMSGLPLIAETFHLKSLCYFARSRYSSNAKKSLYVEIINKLSSTLSVEDYFLIRLLYSKTSGECKGLTRRELNKIYYIRKKKLNLNNSLEFNQLILFLSTHTAMQSSF